MAAGKIDASDDPRSTTGRFVDDYLLYLLARASSEASAEFHKEIKRRGLPILVWRVLASLYGSGGLTVGDLAEICLANQPTISKTLDKMERQGLVARTADSGDRRRVLVALTEHGQVTADELTTAARRHQQRLTEAIGIKETGILVEALKRVIARAKR